MAPARAALLALLWITPGDLAAQRFTLDGELIGGAVSLAWPTGPASSLGVELGAGVPQINHTVRPDTARFEEYLHAAGFYRRRAGALEADLGLRLGVADLYACDASDCWPGWFAGVYGSVFLGWDRVKFGARIVAGPQKEAGEPRTFAVAITPFLLRIAFGR